MTDDPTEPMAIYQKAELMTGDERVEWLRKCADEARAKGAMHARATVSDDGKITLLEVWDHRPKDEGEPRWQATTSDRS